MKIEFRKDDALVCREITSDSVNIQRINNYDNLRFSKKVLLQHGAYLMEDVPYEVEIIGPETAVVRGSNIEGIEKGLRDIMEKTDEYLRRHIFWR